MPAKDVDITTKIEFGEKVIYAEPLTIIPKNGVIKFNNELESTSTNPGIPGQGADAEIQFYVWTPAGQQKISAKKVCKNYKKSDLLLVDAKKHENCKFDTIDYYKYDVMATGYQKPLDPVIIVEPPPFPMLGVIAAAAAILTGLAYYFGFRRGSNQNKP